MSDTVRKELHELVDALPPGEEQAARRYLEYLRDASDRDPFADMPEDDRAKLDASLEQAEREIAAGHGVPAEDLIRELRIRR